MTGELTEEKKKEIDDLIKVVEDLWDKTPPKREDNKLGNVMDFFPLLLEKYRDDNFQGRPYFREALSPRRMMQLDHTSDALYYSIGNTLDYKLIDKVTSCSMLSDYLINNFQAIYHTQQDTAIELFRTAHERFLQCVNNPKYKIFVKISNTRSDPFYWKYQIEMFFYEKC